MKTLLLINLTLFTCISFANDITHFPLNLHTTTPLLTAIISCEFDEAHQLLHQGANPHYSNETKTSALHALAQCDNEDESISFIPILLHHNVDINDVNSKYHFALQEAIVQKRYKLAYAFIEHGASIERKSRDGSSIIHKFNNADLTNPDALKVFKFILSNIKDPDIINKTVHQNISPILLGLLVRNLEYVQILLSQPQIDLYFDENRNLLSEILSAIIVSINTDYISQPYIKPQNIKFVHGLSQIASNLLNQKELFPNIMFMNNLLKNNPPITQLFHIQEYYSPQIPKDSPSYKALEPLLEALSMNHVEQYMQQYMMYSELNNPI